MARNPKPTGVLDHGTSAMGDDRNLGDPQRSGRVPGKGDRDTNAQAKGGAAAARGANEPLQPVGQLEDNRGPLDADAGVTRAHSTDEAGERALGRTPWREGASRSNEPDEGDTCRTLSLQQVFTRLERVAARAREDRTLQFTSLAHLLTVDLLRWAFERLNQNASPGIDRMTADTYRQDLEARLQALHERLREGRYRAQAARRVYIPKEGGRRPLALPALEDKIVQRAVVEVLNAVYEQDFLPCSYGYRPRRSAWDALDAVDKTIWKRNVCWVVEADIQGYFEHIVHKQLLEMLRRRFRDRSLLRLVSKWLHAGVLEDGQLLMADEGTPQGGVISPLLANVYLHYVLDEWVEQIVRPRMRGEIHLTRYADDYVVCFQYRDDAERFLAVLPKRLGAYGLTLHSEKTRLLEFGRFAEENRRKRGKRRPETFDFLGFTHCCAKSRSGKFMVKVRTAKKRLRRALGRCTDWCRDHLHWKVAAQQRTLNQMLQGHYAYYGRVGNHASLRRMYRGVRQAWRKWLGRRRRRGEIPWEAFNEFLQRHPLKPPHVRQQWSPMPTSSELL